MGELPRGEREGGGPLRAAPSLAEPAPAEPSPILMMGERARGQEIGSGSCGSGDSAASRRAGGQAGGGERGCSFDPSAALLGSSCREARSTEGGARGHRARRAAARPPWKPREKEAERPAAGRLGLGGGPGGQQNKAPDAGPGRAATGNARPGQGTRRPARPPPLPRSPRRSAGRPGTRKVNH